MLPQNEAGWAQHYPSCAWDRDGAANLMATYIGGHLGPLFGERMLDTEIWVGTLSNYDDPKNGANSTDTALAEAVMANTEAAKYVKGIGLQWAMVKAAKDFKTKYPNVRLWQTEHECGNNPWEHQSTEWPDGATMGPAPNDFTYANYSWGKIKDWLNTGVTGYMAWNMVLDIDGMSLDEIRPWAQNALLTVDRGSKKLNITPTYYVFRHFAQYVEPGAKRVKIDNDDAFAFRNPDGSIVAVLHNAAAQPSATTLAVGGSKVQFTVPASGWATVNWQPQ
jgi:glucosylceramidase